MNFKMATQLRTAFHQLQRSFSTTTSLNGKKNFRKFMLYNKRGSWAHKQSKDKIQYDLGVRCTGVVHAKYVHINEMVPELIVPDLTGFKLKPYVSYRVPEVVQSEFTSQDLFNACYATKLIEDYKQNKLEESGPLGDSAEEAWIKARKTGSDMLYAKLDLKNSKT